MDFEENEKIEEDIYLSEERVVNKPPKKKYFKSFLLILLIIALVSGTTYTIGYYYGQINLNESKIEAQIQNLLKDNYKAEIYTSVADYLDENGSSIGSGDSDYSEIYDNISGSIVGITSKKTYYDWFNIQRQTGGSGSGVIIGETQDLFYIVTNFHVIDGATEVVVDITDGEVADAQLVGHDADTDLAIVSIKKSDVSELISKTMKPIQIGDSDELRVGEPAIAIGNPLGYNRTLTAGFVSALDRDVQDEAGIKYIQIDAAINPGNSGGALVNRKGELVGINTAKIVDTQVEGIGFAIPSNVMKPIVDEIIENGFVARPYIGIGGVEIGEDDSELYEIPMGVMIRYIYEDSPAEEAGLLEADLIIGVDDVKVFSMDDLTGYISNLKPGDKIDLKIIRDGSEKLTVEVTLGNRGQN